MQSGFEGLPPYHTSVPSLAVPSKPPEGSMQTVYEGLSQCQPSISSTSVSCKASEANKKAVFDGLPCQAPVSSLTVPCKTPESSMQSVFEGLPPCHTSVVSLALSFKTMDSDSASAMLPMCRICHMPEEDGKGLISPCRCSGSLRHVHNSCLAKWIEISSRKRKNRPPRCEICRYHYLRHKHFKFRHLRLPRISRCDKILHTIFFITLVLMIGCAVATVMCFLSDRGRSSQKPSNPEIRVKLTTEEIVTLTCGVMFFVAFFVAMSVQIKARRTIYQILARCINQNMVWSMEQYDRHHDLDYRGPPVAV